MRLGSSWLLALVATTALMAVVGVAASPMRRYAVIDPNFHTNADAVAHYSAAVQYRDADTVVAAADAEDAEDEEEAAEEDAAFVSVSEGADDDGVYYDAANMPSWLVPPWVTPNAPTGPLIPTYGSGYLTKTFNIKQWKGAVPPQPVFPLDTGYAAAAVDSDHHPYGGVFPNDARYHSPSLSVTAPIFAETETTISVAHAAGEGQGEGEGDAADDEEALYETDEAMAIAEAEEMLNAEAEAQAEDIAESDDAAETEGDVAEEEAATAEHIAADIAATEAHVEDTYAAAFDAQLQAAVAGDPQVLAEAQAAGAAEDAEAEADE